MEPGTYDSFVRFDSLTRQISINSKSYTDGYRNGDYMITIKGSNNADTPRFAKLTFKLSVYNDPFIDSDHSYYDICNNFTDYSNNMGGIDAKKGGAISAQNSANVFRFLSLGVGAVSIVVLLVIIRSIDNNPKL